MARAARGPGARRHGADDGAGSGLLRQDGAIVEAAWCYYHDGLTQSAIADRLGVSRASVVNYLAEARRRDYVRISLDSDVFRSNALADGLQRKFDLDAALVVPEGDAGRGPARVVRAAADWLPRLLVPGDSLGVAWGETIFRVSEAITPTAIPDLTVIQLLGSRPAGVGFAAEACSTNISRRLGALCVNLHVPLLLSDAELCRRLSREPSVAEQIRAVRDCNKVVFAAGTCDDDSHIRRSGLLDRDELERFRARGASGVICGHLIDLDGAEIPSGKEDRMIGIDLDGMKAKTLRLLVAAGAERTIPTAAALRGGYATHLVTDARSAAILLEMDP